MLVVSPLNDAERRPGRSPPVFESVALFDERYSPLKIEVSYGKKSQRVDDERRRSQGKFSEKVFRLVVSRDRGCCGPRDCAGSARYWPFPIGRRRRDINERDLVSWRVSHWSRRLG